MTVISDDKVVLFHYKLSEAEKGHLESSYDSEPMAYLHGHNNMLPGLETAMESRSVGDSFQVTLPPDEAYGECRDDAIQRVPIKHLQGLPKGKKTWQPGMYATVHTDQGVRQVTVVKASRFMVTVDTNHPLAGMTLTYDIEIIDIRDASDEEIAHGHAHGPGGHHH